MDLDLGLKNGSSDCQKSTRRAINKTNGNGATRNLLRRVINNLSNSSSNSQAAAAAPPAQISQISSQTPPPRSSIEVEPTKGVGVAALGTTTKHGNFSNHNHITSKKNQIKIDDDGDEFGNKKVGRLLLLLFSFCFLAQISEINE